MCERGRGRESERERQRERERIPSRLCAVSTNSLTGLELTNREIDHDPSHSWTLNQLSHPSTPISVNLYKNVWNLKV